MNKLRIGINERPDFWQWLLFSFQHLFTMFGATVLLPALTDMPVSVALAASGIGTLVYILLTKGKVPVYLGSSFTFLAAIVTANQEYGWASVYTGLIVVGLIYVIVALIIKRAGKDWLHKVLPAWVVGPMIILIGLTLIPIAFGQSGLLPNSSNDYFAFLATDNTNFALALVTFLTAIACVKYGKGILKLLPVLIALIFGTIIAAILGYANPIVITTFIRMPEFSFIWNNGLDFSALYLFIPLAFVSLAEHIGDHTVLGQICDKDFLQEPGLDNTLLGDGIATAISAAIGGPANTTYGENTGVVALSKVGSTWVTGGAAVMAIILSFVQPVHALIASIPTPVMGGVSLILFSLIALNGVKVITSRWNAMNKIEASIMIIIMLVVGLVYSMAIAAIVGISINLIVVALRKYDILKD